MRPGYGTSDHMEETDAETQALMGTRRRGTVPKKFPLKRFRS